MHENTVPLSSQDASLTLLRPRFVEHRICKAKLDEFRHFNHVSVSTTTDIYHSPLDTLSISRAGSTLVVWVQHGSRSTLQPKIFCCHLWTTGFAIMTLLRCEYHKHLCLVNFLFSKPTSRQVRHSIHMISIHERLISLEP